MCNRVLTLAPHVVVVHHILDSLQSSVARKTIRLDHNNIPLALRKRRQRTNAATGSSEAAGEGVSVCEGVSAMVDKSSYFQEYVECITIIIVSMA